MGDNLPTERVEAEALGQDGGRPASRTIAVAISNVSFQRRNIDCSAYRHSSKGSSATCEKLRTLLPAHQ